MMLSPKTKLCFYIAVFSVVQICLGQIPTYYNDVNLSLTGTALRDELATKIIATHTNLLDYTPHIWEASKNTDVDPTDATKVLLIYGYNDSDATYSTDRTRGINDQNTGGVTGWNREHTYSNKAATPWLETGNKDKTSYSDAHNLRPCDPSTNSTRGKKKFTASSGVESGAIGTGWYPGDEWKGDVARIVMYMYLRYGSQCLPLNIAEGTVNSVDNNMIDLLLEWNADDPVSQIEIQRNEYHENTSNTYAQGNRNPFIDNPSFATQIWGGPQATNTFINEPEINVKGNGITINDGSTTVNTSDNTDFGSVSSSGGSVSKQFFVHNIGTQDLILDQNPIIEGVNASNFTVSNVNPLVITSGSSVSFTVTFSPDSDGVKNASVKINSNDTDENEYTFAIKGIGSSVGSNICGSENFNNVSLSSSGYNPGSFTGNNGVFWSYNHSRSESGYGIDGKGMMFQKSGDYLEATNLPGGISSFSVQLKKGFTSNKDRQIELEINGISQGLSETWRDTNIRTFTVNGINISGDIDIKIINRGEQVVIDNIEWTCYSSDKEIEVQGNNIEIVSGTTTTQLSDNTDFGSISVSPGTVTKTFTILNTGINPLTIYQNPSIGGTNPQDFYISQNPNLSIPANGSSSFQVTFDPTEIGNREATVTILNNDTDEGSYTFVISGIGESYAVPCATFSGALIYQQDFEDTPATPELTYSGTITRAGGNGTRPNAPMFIDNKSYQVKNKKSGQELEFNTVDVSNYSNIELSLRLASFSKGSSSNGHEDSDYVTIFISTDGGTTYSEELTVTGKNNARWSFTSGTGIASSNYDGNNPDITFTPSSGGNRTSDGYSTMKISNIPASEDLRIKLKSRNNSSKEIWAIDNVQLTADYNDETTWKSNSWSSSTPTQSTKVIIEDDYDMTSLNDIETCECEVKPGATLTIPANKYINIQNNLVNNGTIIIEDNGSLVQHGFNATISGSGTFIVKRKTTELANNYSYTYWSSPITNATLGNITSNSKYYYAYNSNTQWWATAENTTVMTPGNGYITNGPEDGSYPLVHEAVFTGSPFNSGNVTFPGTYKGLNSDGNLISGDDFGIAGNPYPSAIDAEKLIQENENLGGTLYFWTHNTVNTPGDQQTQDDFVYWNSVGPLPYTPNCSGCTPATQYIASGQSFSFYTVTKPAEDPNIDANFTLNFNNSQRITTNNDNFYRAQEKDRIWLNLQGEKDFSQNLFGFLPNATDGLDRLYDGETIESGDAILYSILNINDTEHYLAIQGKPALENNEEQIIPLGIYVGSAQEISLYIGTTEGKLNDVTVFLEDTKLNTIHNLKESAYKVNLTEAGNHHGRFNLLINSNRSLAIEDINNENPLTIIDTKNVLEVKNTKNVNIKNVIVYDILGKELVNVKTESTTVKIASKQLKKHSILIVKTVLENGQTFSDKLLKK